MKREGHKVAQLGSPCEFFFFFFLGGGGGGGGGCEGGGIIIFLILNLKLRINLKFYKKVRDIMVIVSLFMFKKLTNEFKLTAIES
jgi:hypothetical protein